MLHNYKIKKLRGEDLHKTKGWQDRLAAFLLKWGNRKLKWGKYDCCYLISNAVEAMAEVNPMKECFPHSYKSEVEAYKALCRFSGERSFKRALVGTVSYICSQYGIEDVNIAHRAEGDICIVKEENNQYICGVCVGHLVVLISEKGLIKKSFSNDKFIKVFRVKEWLEQ